MVSLTMREVQNWGIPKSVLSLPTPSSSLTLYCTVTDIKPSLYSPLKDELLLYKSTPSNRPRYPSSPPSSHPLVSPSLSHSTPIGSLFPSLSNSSASSDFGLPSLRFLRAKDQTRRNSRRVWKTCRPSFRQRERWLSSFRVVDGVNWYR